MAVAQSWNAEQYAQQGRFVADMAGGVFELLAPRAGERILDLGCGDGAMTARLAATGAQILGVDASASMVEAARSLGIEARVINAEALPFLSEFDAVFSNAVLHWIPNQEAMLSGVYRALKPDGRFVAEMGGHANIAAISVALSAALLQAGLDPRLADANYFPTEIQYSQRLEAAGFVVEHIALIPRRTPLPASGMRGWLETFRRGMLERFTPEQREQVLESAIELLRPVLYTEGEGWIADYVRLRFQARKPA